MDKVIAGIVLLALSVWGTVAWWWFIWDILRGLGIVALFAVGLLLVGSGIKCSCRPAPEPAKTKAA